MIIEKNMTKTLPLSRLNNFQDGVVLLVDKPLTWTSFDVVNKVRITLKNDYNAGKVKVGHAGTLDPLASGLLILCTGKFTKQIDSIQAEEKEYEGTMQLGASTPSYDKETEIDREFDITGITNDQIYAATEQFKGSIIQTPPAYSARKVDGERAYKKARRKENVRMPKTAIEIKEFEILKIDLPAISFRVVCSKGTYIRSLVHDFGEALNNGAFLSSLIRTRIGGYHLYNALPLEKLLR